MTFAHHNWNWFAEVDGPTGKTKSAAPYQTNFFVIDEHCGTHFDAPTHFIPPPDSGLPLASDLGAQTGDKVPLEDLMGPGVVVDVSYLSGQGSPGSARLSSQIMSASSRRSTASLQRARSSCSGRTGTGTTWKETRERST
jgi:hypothetical protein